MRLPRVFVVAPAKQFGKLGELRRLFTEADTRGDHIHWVVKGKHTCRNGTPDCPFYAEEE